MTHLLTIDPNFQRDIQVRRLFPGAIRTKWVYQGSTRLESEFTQRKRWTWLDFWGLHIIYTWNLFAYFGASTLQKKAQTPIKTGVIRVPGSRKYKLNMYYFMVRNGSDLRMLG